MSVNFSPKDETGVTYYPLSYGQRALWFLHDFDANGHAYNMSYAWYLRSEIDIELFKKALVKLVERHPVMRSVFVLHRGEPVQKTFPDMPVSFREKDASSWKEDEVRKELTKEVYRPFELDKEPPIRWTLFRRQDGADILFLALHHMGTDVWSVMTILNEIKKFYQGFKNGEEVDLPPLELNNGDFVSWQKEFLEGPDGASMLAFWKDQLSGELPVLNLQTDKPRPPIPSFKGESFQFDLPQELMARLVAMGSANGASPFVTCLAAYHTFLHRFTGQEDIISGVPTAGRDDRFGGIFHYYVSPIVMRSQPESGKTFLEFLQEVRNTTEVALKNQAYPFPLLAQKIKHDMDSSRPPIFQTSFVWENSNRFENRKEPMVFFNEQGNERWELGDIHLERIILKLQLDEFDLIMKMVKVGEDYYGLLDYNPDLFHIETIQRMSENFKVLLQSIADTPERKLGKLSLLTEPEKAILLNEWNNTADPYPDVCPYQMIEQQVAEHPDQIAIRFENESLTYEEFNKRANRLANHLRNLGVGPDNLVGISLERSPNMILSQVSTQKAGGAYVPLDPNYPEERIQYILEEARVSVVLTQEKLRDRFKDYEANIVCLDSDWHAIESLSSENLAPLAGMNHLSHVIYTSGSTGKPKGVAIEHHSVSALIGWTARTYSAEELSGMLASTSLNFDLSVYETITTLALGGSIILVENALYLPTAPARHQVKLINTVPSAIKELVRMKAIPESVITVNLAGEPLKNAVVQSLYDIPHIQKVYNLYGPSEDTTYSTWALMERGPDYVVMIGEPLTNTQCYVLDPGLELVPLGVPGELYMAGDGLAREYLNRPDLTEERFMPNPFGTEKSTRIYKTGDLVKYWKNGQLECLGRIDHQVKIRGFRIELGEIEAVLQRNSQIHEAVVIDREGKNGEKILVGYVTLVPGEDARSQDLRSWLKEHLPDYMVPAFLMILPKMPLNPNGKIDRKQLPEPELDIQTTAIVQPQNEIEKTIAEIWKEVLHLNTVGINDKFFDLGGNSLLLPQVKFKLEEKFNKSIQTTDLFQYPTIKALAGFLNPGTDESELVSQTLRRQRIVKSDQHDIAVIGLAGRFPGAENVEVFWQNLVEGKETITHFSQDELLKAGVDPELLADPDYVRARGILGDVSLFDAPFFGFNPRDAEVMDPQHRFFLEGAWEALENAGYNPDAYKGRIGVFAGSSMSSYYQFNIAPNQKLLDTVGAFQAMVANDKDFLATRVSYNFNLKGPGVTVQSACSTSLVAIHQACKSLLIGESDMALAGGVTIQVPQEQGYVYNEGGIHSPDGHVRPFDANAKGMVVSSGMGIVVLKRLDDALADGDRVLAVVKGTAINNDGSLKVGYTAPSVEGQAEAIADAQYFGNVNPESISYIETHGTGTALGDPIEVAALTRAFRLGTKKSGYCALGALKSNIGHLDAAAGVAGFIKAVLSLAHKKIPATLHFQKPNPAIDFSRTPFFVNHQLTDWQPEGNLRRAGVSAFGIGGTNAHVILEEGPEPVKTSESRPFQLFVLSARTPSALEKTTTNLLTRMKNDADLSMADAAYTLKVGRKPFNNRRVFVGRDRAEAIEILETHDSKRMYTGSFDARQRPVVFMFSGQGAQYPNMTRDLYLNDAGFKNDIDHCCEYLKSHIDLDLRELMYPGIGLNETPDLAQLDAAAQKLAQTSITQPALFVVEYCLARMWIRLGIQPQAMIGHSIGEYVAACLSGVFDLESSLALVATRGRLMQSQPEGSMMAIPLPEEEILPYLEATVSMATINAPNRCVVAGPDDALQALEKRLTQEGKKCTMLRTSHAFHSWMMDGILAPFTAEVARNNPQAPSLPFISNVTGKWITKEQATDPSYWAQHLRNAVRFADGLSTLAQEPDHIYLEVGPGNTLMTFVKQQLGRDTAKKAFASARHPKTEINDFRFVLETLGQLWLLGQEIDWDQFYAGETRRRIALPGYPFERRRYWVDPVTATDQKPKRHAPLRKRPDMKDWFYTPVWVQDSPINGQDLLQHDKSIWLIFSDDLGYGEALESALRAQGKTATLVKQGSQFQENGPNNYSINLKNESDYSRLIESVIGDKSGPIRIAHLWNLTSNEVAESRVDFAARCQETGFFSLINLARALDNLNSNQPIQIGIVSNNLHAIAGEQARHPEKAPLLGPCRVIPREFPGISCRNIDIVTGQQNRDQSINNILGEMLTLSSDLVIAYRNRYRWVQEFRKLPLAGKKQETNRLRQGGVYLITGGLGGIGLVIADFLAKTFKSKLILTRRSKLPEREKWDQWLRDNPKNDKTSHSISSILDLEAAGAEVMVGASDVTDLVGMKKVVAEAQQRFGPINGVVHAAGLYPSGMIQDIKRESAIDVMSPKITGTLVLDELFQHSGLDFMVLFSSTSTILGNMGFVDYCSSNAFLDAFAFHQDINNSTYTVSMSWDGWKEVGMAVDQGMSLDQLANMMGPAEGIEAFKRILYENDLPQVLVSPLDLERMLEEIKIFLSSNFENNIPDGQGTVAHEDGTEIPAEGSKGEGGARTSTQKAVTLLWEEALGVSNINLQDDFHDLGGDSLLATMLATKMRKAFKIKMHPSVIGEFLTVEGVSRYIDEQKGTPAPEQKAPTALAEPPEVVNAKADPEETPKVNPRPALKAQYAEPSTETEKQIAQLYAQALNIEKVGIHDNFLELGGYTELATSLTRELEELFGVELPPGVPINEPTVSAVAERIETIRWASNSIDASLEMSDEDEEFEL